MGGLLLACPEMITNGVGVVLLLPAVLLGKFMTPGNILPPDTPHAP